MGTEPKKKMKPERMGHRVTLKKKGLMKKAPPQERMSLERKPAEGQKLAEGTDTAEALSLSCTVSKRDQIRSH